MRAVITKPLQRQFAAFFGGDWLSFLGYLEEGPSPNEQISTVLPEARLYVGASSRVNEVAEEHGIPADEVERMLASFWSSGVAESPVHQRVRVLREFWDHFDIAHARQAPGMESLWGLADVEDVQLAGLDNVWNGPAWYNPGQYRTKLPDALLVEISTLWDGMFLPLAPDRIVTSSSPFNEMLEAFGPALRFWHGVGLTIWFLTEGPISRTDIAGLEQYHRRDVEALALLGAPIDTAMFAELVGAEKGLGKPEPYTTRETESDFNGGLGRLSAGMSIGTRRSGFEGLRDIVTQYRRTWATKYLDEYLRARWESEIRQTAREFARHLEVKRKPPTGKQFAKVAEAPANHWFGGDAGSLYAAFGEKAPTPMRRVRLLPSDTTSLAVCVFYALGGSKTEAPTVTYREDEAERARRQAERDAHSGRTRLSTLSVWYAQLREALGRQPSVVEFGRARFEPLSAVLDEDPVRAWTVYAAAVDSCLPL
jgi:hypothetical protein